MNIIIWIKTHKRSIFFLFFCLALAGWLAMLHISVSLFPATDFPRVMISLDAGQRTVEQTLLQVTAPVEEGLRQIPGIQDLRSSTGRGKVDISLNFNWGVDMRVIISQVNTVLTQSLPFLPAGTQFDVKHMDPSLFPILAYSLTSERLTEVELRELAQYQLRPLLTTVNGVANVMVVGGQQAEYHITVNAPRLASYGLTLNDLTQAITDANISAAVGRLEANYQLYLIVANNSISTQQTLENIILPSKTHQIITLKQVAEVSLSTVPQWIRVNSNGKRAVLLQVFQQPQGNSIQITQDIERKLASFKQRLPRGVELIKWYDQSELVTASEKSVRDAIITGLVLAALVIWFFLRNAKITLIAILMVPASLAVTTLILYGLNMSLNIMTLGGMAAAVGLIIDDAIVMMEQIIRQIRAKGEVTELTILSATKGFFHPLLGSSLATTIIFLPLAFLGGVTGAFFKALSMTMATALIFSFFFAWLVLPLLANWFLSDKDSHESEESFLTRRIHPFYERTLKKLFSQPQLLLWIILPVILLGFLAYHYVGSGFMPVMDEGGFNLDYVAPAGTSLSETDRLVTQIEQQINTIPDIESYSRRTGLTFGGADPYSDPNQGDFIIRLKPYPRRSVDVVINDLRSKIEQNIPGIDIEFAQLMEDMIGNLTEVPQPIEIKIFSDNESALLESATKIADVISHINGVVDIVNGIHSMGGELNIYVDPAKAALQGMNPSSMINMLGTDLTGTIATNLPENQRMVGVRVLNSMSSWSTQDELARLILAAPDGHLFPLKSVATLTEKAGQAQISRENLQSMIAVTARINGRDMGSVIKDIEQQLTQKNLLPADGYYELGGLYKQQQEAFKGLLFVFITAFSLVFLLQLFLYEQFLIVLAIMSIPLLSVASIMIGMWVIGTELNIASIMGIIMILGITTEVAIFYFSEYRQLSLGAGQSDISDETKKYWLITAGKNRLRPISMTTFATILTLFPLAIAQGQGASMEQPLAVAIILGLLVQLPCVLLVMPALFFVLGRKRTS
ncbi:MAG: efflux RND transporter permease subunit [Legionellales bacterium]|nr:efflux RND transporter permease subunit [Legionellales bacterium]